MDDSAADAVRPAPLGSSAASAWINLPNAISLLRIPLAAAFALVSQPGARILIAAVSAFSDWVDGQLARRRGQVTRAGELLDPIADRTFMIVAAASLARAGMLPWWALPLLLLRDIGGLTGAAVVLAMDRRARLPARRAGKRLTWLQFATIVTLLVHRDTGLLLLAPVAVLSVIALADYARQARRVLRHRRGLE